MEKESPKPESFSPYLDYLAQIVQTRLLAHFDPKNGDADLSKIPRPNGKADPSPLGDFLKKHSLKTEELILLLVALAPHVQPHFFDKVIAGGIPEAGDFPQIGGLRGKQFRGFLPTGETVMFLLAGENLKARIAFHNLFDADFWMVRDQLIRLDPPERGEPRMSGRLVLGEDYINLLTLGRITRPEFSMEFPAQRIQTDLDWEDLVLSEQTMAEIHELEAWVRHGDTLLHDWGMKKRLKPGFRSLFHGPPGTGKTLTASLLGKFTRKEVYKVDLSMVVSKYIGETEKNLAQLFAKAENKGWILFFDEADALFGKRTNVRDAHDKYANQEVSYLLQRVENYDGLVILASNFKSNIDDAFMRRFQAVIHFPMPGPAERLQIWKKGFPPKAKLSADLDLEQIARKYELSGAGIMNVIQFACLAALNRDSATITQQDVLTGIRRELGKVGKIL